MPATAVQAGVIFQVALTEACILRGTALIRAAEESIAHAREIQRILGIGAAEWTGCKTEAVGGDDIHRKILLLVFPVAANHEVDRGVQIARIAQLAGVDFPRTRLERFGGYGNVK